MTSSMLHFKISWTSLKPSDSFQMGDEFIVWSIVQCASSTLMFLIDLNRSQPPMFIQVIAHNPVAVMMPNSICLDVGTIRCRERRPDYP